MGERGKESSKSFSWDTLMKKDGPMHPVVGPFRIGNQLGKGTFATVWKGFNVKTGQIVAIKEVPISEIIPQNQVKRVLREINILKELHHPNILRYINFYKHDDCLSIILDYAEAGSLRDLLVFGLFTEDLAALYTKQILEGLAYLHEKQIIHRLFVCLFQRDIKGANILLTKAGEVKLSDFGLSAKLEDGLSTPVAGSPYWMAPEVLELAQVGEPSDIWSLGCTIVELLTGEPPFIEFGPMMALVRIMEDSPPMPAGISSSASEFLSACFQRNPEERPTAKQLLQFKWIGEFAPQPPSLKTVYSRLKTHPSQRSLISRDSKYFLKSDDLKSMKKVIELSFEELLESSSNEEAKQAMLENLLKERNIFDLQRQSNSENKCADLVKTDDIDVNTVNTVNTVENGGQVAEESVTTTEDLKKELEKLRKEVSYWQSNFDKSMEVSQTLHTELLKESSQRMQLVTFCKKFYKENQNLMKEQEKHSLMEANLKFLLERFTDQQLAQFVCGTLAFNAMMSDSSNSLITLTCIDREATWEERIWKLHSDFLICYDLRAAEAAPPLSVLYLPRYKIEAMSGEERCTIKETGYILKFILKGEFSHRQRSKIRLSQAIHNKNLNLGSLAECEDESSVSSTNTPKPHIIYWKNTKPVLTEWYQRVTNLQPWYSKSRTPVSSSSESPASHSTQPRLNDGTATTKAMGFLAFLNEEEKKRAVKKQLTRSMGTKRIVINYLENRVGNLENRKSTVLSSPVSSRKREARRTIDFSQFNVH